MIMDDCVKKCILCGEPIVGMRGYGIDDEILWCSEKCKKLHQKWASDIVCCYKKENDKNIEEKVLSPETLSNKEIIGSHVLQIVRLVLKELNDTKTETI